MPFSKPLLLLRSLSVQPLKLQLKHWRRLPKVLQMQQMMQPQCSKLSRQLQKRPVVHLVSLMMWLLLLRKLLK